MEILEYLDKMLEDNDLSASEFHWLTQKVSSNKPVLPLKSL